MENRLKKGLGRGLSSLLGDTSKKVETNKVAIKDITRNKFQPRKNFSKEALEDSSSDLDKAIEFLRKKGISTAQQKKDRSTSEGLIAISKSHSNKEASIIEINSSIESSKINPIVLITLDLAERYKIKAFSSGISD